jgi:hypothetical protein
MELVFEIPDPPLSIAVSGVGVVPAEVVALAAAESVVFPKVSFARTT